MSSMDYTAFHTCYEEIYETQYLIDTGGAKLYEDGFGGLLRSILTYNDIPMLKQYIEVHNLTRVPITETFYWDPFLVAATSGSLDALRTLLDIYYASPGESVPINERGFSLLTEACGAGQLEVVRFLLDSDPPLGTIHERDPWGQTPLMCAAAGGNEALVHLLLDRGASARDTRSTPGKINVTNSFESTVLSRAITAMSYATIKRLIDEGADLQLRDNGADDFQVFGSDPECVRDVTMLHLGSIRCNAEGLRCLLDQGGRNLIACRDSLGQLPLHWAAAAPDPKPETEKGSVVARPRIGESELESRILGTFQLLLTEDPSAINAQDSKGATPLHYAVRAHAPCGSRGHAYRAIEFLCKHGANACQSDNKGQTVLHLLALRSAQGDPINIKLLDLLLANGAPINHMDQGGNTALHFMSKNLRQRAAAKALLDRRADVHMLNAKGNTPLHEAMTGLLFPPALMESESENTVEELILAQDEVVAALQEAAGGVSCNLMNRPNANGETPRQLCEQTKEKWREMRKPIPRRR